MKILFALLIATAAFALTPEQELAAALAQQKTAADLANKIGSEIAAGRIDSLYQLDSTLVANQVRVVGGGIDSVWVKVAVGKLNTLKFRLVRVVLSEANLKYTAIGSDTLSMRRDRAEKALPVIAAALKDTL